MFLCLINKTAPQKDFLRGPYVILDPNIRRFPDDEYLREQGYGELLPPFVPGQ
jgi:hypothetical protein